jgi:hypothetical protein
VATFMIVSSPYDASHTFLVNLDLVRRAERVRHASGSHVPDRTLLYFSDKDDDCIEVLESFEEIAAAASAARA